MENKFPLISVGIPTFNRLALLDKAIKCTVNQTYKNLEIIMNVLLKKTPQNSYKITIRI